MRLNFKQFVLIFSGASFGMCTVIQAQTENEVPALAPLSEVEDTTLDGSGAAAADAANSTGPATPAIGDQPVEPAVAASESEPTTKANQPADAPVAADQSATPGEETTSSEPAVPASPPAEVSSTKEAKAQSEESDSHVVEKSVVKGIYGGRVFGRYRIQLAGNRPTFNEGQKCYDKFYGKPETYFSMSGDWFPADWWINPGIMMRMGTYSARGKAAQGATSNTAASDCNSLTVDTNSRTKLLFVPLQVGVKIQLTPFSRKWFVVDVWSAGEYGWWQETRDSTTTAMVTPINLLAANQVYTNTGRKRAISTGASVHLLLNYLDERTVRSMVDSMGLGYVYLTGFMENVKSSNKTGLNFGRKVVGVGFTFETYK